VLYDGIRLVPDSGKKLFLARVRRVHVAVEHQIFAASGPGPSAHDIRAALLDFLPAHVQSKLLQSTVHVLRHLQLVAGWTWNIDDVATHRDDLFFPHFSDDPLHCLRIERRRVFLSRRMQNVYLCGADTPVGADCTTRKSSGYVHSFSLPDSVIRKLSSSLNPPPPAN